MTYQDTFFRTFAALFMALAVVLPAQAQSDEGPAVTPPRPVLPIPTERQLEWQKNEMALFLHFTVNTFTDREWGDGTEDPDVFQPKNFSARQWAHVAKNAGFKTVLLTAKHHDGFALWPSKYTEHDVASSSWRKGNGDVVGALAEAAREEDLNLGLYLSPWDRHEPTYGTDAYNAFYMAQLRELLSNYGSIREVWFDGAKGKDAEDMSYDFDAYWALVRQLQPDAVLFSDIGPDVRWIGNEHGFAADTNWSMIDTAGVSIGSADQNELNTGDRNGSAWIPGECDVSIRDGWFWHADESPKSLDTLMEIYYKSVGRNCKLLLNAPPNDEGRISQKDAQRLYAFRDAIENIYDPDFAAGQHATANTARGKRYGPQKVLDGDYDTYWAAAAGRTSGTLEVRLDEPARFNVVRLQEPIDMGQRVSDYRVEAWQDGAWKVISEGTTIGYRKLDRFEPVTAQRVRLVIEDSRASPLLNAFGLHFDPHPQEGS